MFNYNNYINDTLDNKGNVSPHELWETIKNELTAAEKVAAFDEFCGKPYMLSLLQNRNRANLMAAAKSQVKTAFSVPDPQPVGVGTLAPKPKIVHAGGAVTLTGVLAQMECTHNPNRTGDGYVVLGDWTEDDFLCSEQYFASFEKTYSDKRKSMHNMVTAFKDNPGAKTFKEVYPYAVEKWGVPKL